MYTVTVVYILIDTYYYLTIEDRYIMCIEIE